MTQPGVSDSDMPALPWSTHPEAHALDALLDGSCRPEETPAALLPVAEVLAALQAPPDRREVAGWGEALTVYRDTAVRPGTHGRPRTRRPRGVAAPLGTRLAAAAAAAALAVLGGGAAAAYTGSLPSSLQKIAHDVFAAPAVRARPAAPTARDTARPLGPSVTGNAAGGLCNAYQHAAKHGNASQRAVAFRNLVNAAGGADRVAAYCAAAQPSSATTAPGRRVGQGASPADANHGRKPTAPPGKPTAPPGKPTAPPGKPTAPPGKPTTTPGNGGGNGHGNGPGKQL